MITIRHAGDLGDIIWSLPALKWLATTRGEAVDILIESAKYTRMPMDGPRFDVIKPLLACQPYINRVEWFQEGMRAHYNMNDFRAAFFPALRRNPKLASRVRLTDWQAAIVGAPASCADDPWLKVDPKHVAKYVINRTPRYNNPQFPWARILCSIPFPRKVAFIGTEEEHRLFESDLQIAVDYLPTADLLEAARVIAGADCFIGNQSACYAIAEGLKKPAVLEVFPQLPNCLFSRPDVVHGWDDSVRFPRNHQTPLATA